MRYVILLILANMLYFNDICFASPAINAITGGQSSIIDCTGAGEKTTATPYKWDNAEGKDNGVLLNTNGWLFSMGNTEYPVYSTISQQRNNNSLSNIYCDNRSTYNTSFCLSEAGAFSRIYVSYWTRVVTTGNASRNVKAFGLRKNSNSDPPAFRFDLYPSTSSGHIYFNDSNANELPGSYACGNDLVADGNWHRREFYVYHGTEGNTDASAKYVRDCITKASIANLLARIDSNTFGTVVINYYFARDEVGTPLPSAEFWYDDVYIDTVWNHVELGNSSSYTSCTHREIQIPTSWSDTSITITVNQGSFSDGELVYLFVIDSDGNASEGYPVIISGGQLSPPPIQANNLTANNVTFGG